MKRTMLLLALAALGTAFPAAAAAQGTVPAQPAPPAPAAPTLMQRSFVYLAHDLRVTVTGEPGGTIQVLRGEPGRLEVTGRSDTGLTTAALASGARDELTLTASGGSRVEYVLVVPTDVRVTVRLPGQPGATLGTLARSGSWSWTAQPATTEPLPRR